MTELAELKKIWEVKQRQVGALRLQSSEGDCVPTTVINALLYLTEDRIHPKLQRLIWSVALDEVPLTGWVGCQLVADVIDAWSNWTHKDGNASNKKRKFISEIRPKKTGDEFDVSKILGDIQVLVEKNAGVVCLTCRKGGHYALLHSFDGENFYGFDSYLRAKDMTSDVLFEYNDTVDITNNKRYEMVNFLISKDNLKKLLEDKVNQWIHVIARP
jgi:hypothetical protein